MGQRRTTGQQLLYTQTCILQLQLKPSAHNFLYISLIALQYFPYRTRQVYKMNQKSLLFTPKALYSPLIYSYIILFNLLTRTTLCFVEPKFEACQPRTCGNNQSISYPFYIQGVQEPFCGYPGFGVSCSNDGFPILNLSNTLHIIDQILYQNLSLRVSNAVLSTSNTTTGCPFPTKNLTLPSIFHFVPNQKDVRLFFDCDLPSVPRELQEQIIECSADREKSSVLALYKDDKNLSFASKNCKGEVVDVTVEDDDDDGKGGIEEALRKGFWLNWTASDCRECNSTGEAQPKKKRTKLNLLLGLGIAVALLLLLALNLTFRCLRKQNCATGELFIERFLKQHGSLPTTRYSYSQIKKVTDCFKVKLGEGGYGSVYKGKLQDGSSVAVKVLNELKGTGEEFINEIASISRTSHVNIVTLVGFCFQGSKRALVYEFMPNGSLEKFICEETPMLVGQQLACKTLYDVAIGVARGLDYLHRGCNTKILHFDIKPHNILLDEDFCPKISDFGLAKICPRKESIVSMLGARGTIGYIAPEVFCRTFGGVSHKSDVYSYGMLVLEMVGGRQNKNVELDCSSEIYFPHWIYKKLELDQDFGFRCIENESDRVIVRKMIMVSLWCIQTDPLARPSMSKVVEMLEGSHESLKVPPKPFLRSPPTSPAHYSSESTQIS